MITLTPIAHVQSCYPERFGIPRQAGLVPSATAAIVFSKSENHKLSLRGLERFSHIWVVFLFHQGYAKTKPLVQPPRLGGKKTMGVYATRSPNRPNPIGLSAVSLDRVDYQSDKILIHIRGGDFLDGTPVLDIKPYIPYADAIPEADSAWAIAEPPPLLVLWSAAAQSALEASQGVHVEQVRTLIAETIAQDPRPAHERGKDGRPGQQWNMRVKGFDVFWQVEAGVATVTHLTQLS
ncbi:tRNA (adenine(37)-N6)-methyltransferase [Acaryochloris thomasi RCC1774]|uniref:tRNA (Adenine(37)-N6)-methyltransferase n=1 Tax=Acaryochloris thomasi RCC1774 TaxID=1764569 RepID=A0A2W1JTH2_9CYAN|nr:tRNA (N6-threonylcarbamoyladenosine(37)-N6)-methyltransferase TrmO [Acaryochloris thomasi]PZD71937.1 tRNA (adenine(37)-N6)-methyltransferase [Acaryochloris thomasi RCC1774]